MSEKPVGNQRITLSDGRNFRGVKSLTTTPVRDWVVIQPLLELLKKQQQQQQNFTHFNLPKKEIFLWDLGGTVSVKFS